MKLEKALEDVETTGVVKNYKGITQGGDVSITFLIRRELLFPISILLIMQYDFRERRNPLARLASRFEDLKRSSR